MKFLLLTFFVFFLALVNAQNTEVFEYPLAEELTKVSIFTVVEKMPIFTQECFEKVTRDNTGIHINNERLKCSNLAIQQYMHKVYYPQQAIDEKIEGKVYISFVVDTLGEVIDVTLIRGVHKLLDNEALYQVKNMPAFYKPGYQNGVPVKVKFTVPIVFKVEILSDEEIKKYRKEVFGK